MKKNKFKYPGERRRLENLNRSIHLQGHKIAAKKEREQLQAAVMKGDLPPEILKIIDR